MNTLSRRFPWPEAVPALWCRLSARRRKIGLPKGLNQWPSVFTVRIDGSGHAIKPVGIARAYDRAEIVVANGGSIRNCE